MRERVCRSLKGRANNDEAHRKPDHAPAAKDIANAEIDTTAYESTETVGGDCDAGDDIVGVAELVAKVFIFEQTGEDTLVVAMARLAIDYRRVVRTVV